MKTISLKNENGKIWRYLNDGKHDIDSDGNPFRVPFPPAEKSM